MIVSAYSDGLKHDKIAEFYDTEFPCLFMRGLLTQAKELEKDIEITFTAHDKPVNEKETINYDN